MFVVHFPIVMGHYLTKIAKKLKGVIFTSYPIKADRKVHNSRTYVCLHVHGRIPAGYIDAGVNSSTGILCKKRGQP